MTRPRRGLRRPVAGIAVTALLALVACTSGDGAIPRRTTTTAATTTAATTTAATSTIAEPTTSGAPLITTAPATSTSSTTLPPPLARPVSSTGDAGADATLLAAARFVEQARGRPLRRPITVELLAPDRFEDAVLEAYADEGFVQGLRAQEQVLVILGLIPAGTDFVEISRIVTREGVLGQYDPVEQRLIVRGSDLTPFVVMTVVHELTHALDDQWFDLEGADIAEGDADGWFALGALAEGSAQTVEQQYYESLTDAQRADLAREAIAFTEQMEYPEVPPAAAEISETRYSLGLQLVAPLLSSGGMDALDAAFADPPRSTEQILHPDKFATREPVVAVEVPAHPGRRVEQGTMGEESLIELLNSEMAPATARTAAAGWGGDRFVLYDLGPAVCVKIDVALDSVDDARELESALATFARHQPDAIVDRLGRLVVELTVCR